MSVGTESPRSARPRIVVGTSRQLCRTVAKRWNNQYGDKPSNPRHGEIQERLRALKKKGTKAEIDKIIGNETWTSEWCDVCARRVELWVTLGASDYEVGTSVCQECLEDAVVELENAPR